MIELAARRNIAIDFAVSVNQHWITANSFGGEQRLKQRVLVFAIAVTVLENFGSGVWLKTSNAEGEADVANVFRGKVIQPAGFFFGSGRAAREFGSFGFDGWIGSGTFTLELWVPSRNLLPVGEAGELDVSGIVVVFFLGMVGTVGNEILYAPAINAAVGFVAGFVLMIGALELNLAGFGDIYFESSPVSA